jgi:citrate synthase
MERSTNGLEGVVVADTLLSHVDGERGELWLRGEPVERLAGRVGFEAALGLLVGGALPDAAGVEQIRALLARGRSLAFERLPRLGDALDRGDAMDALRAGVAHFDERELGCGVESAALLAGIVATIGAAWATKACRAPDPSLPHARDHLRMLGARAGEDEAAALDAYWVTVIDHGMNASTFAARVVASTGSDLVSGVTAAVGALKGPLHGGAPGPVLDMLDAIGEKERAEGWLSGELAAGRRIMGMGHRIYRVRDPRAAVLERALERYQRALGPGGGAAAARLELARGVERAAEHLLGARHPERSLRANVEFYTAVLLEAVGVPRELFSATFAASRVAGWCAHVAEQREAARLIRPASRYVGPKPL